MERQRVENSISQVINEALVCRYVGVITERKTFLGIWVPHYVVVGPEGKKRFHSVEVCFYDQK